ncbi:MAG: rhomboid family intramembrane serine protease [Nitrospirae bacterium]|nr:rhomboid family intramembrane serine protease [Nitrospirota bacterium]
MNVLDRLERRFGRYAVRQLISYIVGINALVYMLRYGMPESDAISKLWLDPRLILQGELWRLITWIFIPPSASLIWIFFILYFYYMIGIGLEHEWGSFRFNVYYLTGMAATVLAAFIVGEGSTAIYLNLSLFLAFAAIYPDFEILLFFILPVKVKYLAWVNWAFIVFTVLTAPLAGKAAALVSVANYFLFFGRDVIRDTKNRGATLHRRSAFTLKREKGARGRGTMHKCTVCSITEDDAPVMEFRYCSTCDGHYEYCMKHLREHEHIKEDKGQREKG